MSFCSKHITVEKELRSKEKAWEKDWVSLDQQLTTQMKQGYDCKKKSDHYRAEFNDARKQSNTFKTELDSLNSDDQ